MTDGGTFNGQTVTGLGTTKAARIYYQVQTTMLTSGSEYADLANALPQACTNLIGTAGITAADCSEVGKAVAAIEMGPSRRPATEPEAPICAQRTRAHELVLRRPGEPRQRQLDPRRDPAPAGSILKTRTRTRLRPDLRDERDHEPLGLRASRRGRPLRGRHDRERGDPGREPHLPALQPRTRFRGLPLWGAFDGGVLEYSTDGGASYADAGSLLADGGYNGTIASGYGNPLGRSQRLCEGEQRLPDRAAPTWPRSAIRASDSAWPRIGH